MPKADTIKERLRRSSYGGENAKREMGMQVPESTEIRSESAAA